MDRPGVDADELRRALQYIRRVNKYLGYNRATRQRVAEWIRPSHPPTHPLSSSTSILDVATGSGDVPLDLLAWAAKRGITLQITGLDLHPTTLAAAQHPQLTLVQGDATRLPFEDNSFDYVLTSMFLHHLSEQQTVSVMKEMWRVARKGVLAADLLRTRGALAGIWLLTRLSSPMIRHDAVVSVKQAFTSDEIRKLATGAGWLAPDLREHRNYRFTVVASKPPLA